MCQMRGSEGRFHFLMNLAWPGVSFGGTGGFFAASNLSPASSPLAVVAANVLLTAAAWSFGVPRVSTTAWKICQPFRCGPLTFQEERALSDSRRKRPRLVPAHTTTRSVMGSPFEEETPVS